MKTKCQTYPFYIPYESHGLTTLYAHTHNTFIHTTVAQLKQKQKIEKQSNQIYKNNACTSFCK